MGCGTTLPHYLILNLKNTASRDNESMDFSAVQQNRPAIDGIFSSSVTAAALSSTAAAAAAPTREASLGDGRFSPWGVQSVSLVISDAFHFGATSNGSSSSSPSPLS